VRRVTVETQTWLAARDFLLDRSNDFFLQLARSRETFEAEAIHDLRVATRRLREGIALFDLCFRKRQFVPLRRELKRLTDMLGAIRNTDEALLFFSPLAKGDGERGAAAGLIAMTLTEERHREQGRLKKELKKIDPGAIPGRIGEICSNPRIFNPNAVGLFQPVADYLLQALAVRETAMLELLHGARQEENVAAQHRLRIAVKRFRYRLEFLAPLAGDGYRAVYRAVKGYQEILGKMHDLDVFRSMVGERVADPAGKMGLEGVIAGRRRDLFGEFMTLQERDPLAGLIPRMRSLL
jgi:CHAD domain-containing protein